MAIRRCVYEIERVLKNRKAYSIRSRTGEEWLQATWRGLASLGRLTAYPRSFVIPFHHYSTQQKSGAGSSDASYPTRRPRKLVSSTDDPFPSSPSSALLDSMPSGYNPQDTKPTIEPLSYSQEPESVHVSNADADPELETLASTPPNSIQDESSIPEESPVSGEMKSKAASHQQPPPKLKPEKSTTTKTKSPSSSKKSPSESQKYAMKVLHEDILETPTTPNQEHDVSALSEEELRLYKVVQHLIDEGFIDDLEFFNLIGKRRDEIASKSESEVKSFENKYERNLNDRDKKPNNVSDHEWRQQTIRDMDMDTDKMAHHLVSKTPLRVNMKQFMLNRNPMDPLHSLREDDVYELDLDDRDLKHILLHLIHNHLNTKRFNELNPSIKELASLLYGIRNQGDFNRLLTTMSRTRKQIQSMMQKYPFQAPPHLLVNYDRITDLEFNPKTLNERGEQMDQYRYDEYGQNIDQKERNLTSFELDSTIKRIQDLEFRQFGYTQPVAQKYNENDDHLFVNVVQDEEEEEKQLMSKDGGAVDDEDDEDDDDEGGGDGEEETQRKGYYQSVMEKVQEQWNGDLMDIKHVGGDWRVRLGIAERQGPNELDIEGEIERQYKRTLNESIAYTARRRYKMSPWKIRSLPYAEARELDINFTNVKLLNKFVNDRGMILPRRFTGVDKRTQKRIAKAIKRSRKIGFMPHMSKLILFDRDKVKRMQEDLLIKQFYEKERDHYELMTLDDLRAMYPEYAPMNDEELEKMRAGFKEREEEESKMMSGDDGDGMGEVDDLEIDFSKEYGIDEDELVYQTQLRKQQNMFMKQIKKDIVKKIPEYWQKRLSFRDKSNQMVNQLHQKQKEKNKDQFALSANRNTPPPADRGEARMQTNRAY